MRMSGACVERRVEQQSPVGPRSALLAEVFMNKEVHKEHLDQLESRLSTVSQSVEKWGEEAFCPRSGKRGM